MITKEFTFGTKSSNLKQLQNKLITGKVCEVYTLTVQQWLSDPHAYFSEIKQLFKGSSIVVRSSAPSEDSIYSSMAGAFHSVINVDSRDFNKVSHAINEVKSSYLKLSKTNDISNYEILIQPMVMNVISSGVVFTRDLGKLGPYYVVNYDKETGKTDSITAGYDVKHNTVYIHRDTEIRAIKDEMLKTLINTIQEVENITGSNCLDIEFAIDTSLSVYILQVRPLVTTQIIHFQMLDKRITTELEYIEEFLQAKFCREANLFGETTIFGQMPDWNPAEIIGTRPTPLASSLYRYLITNSSWREGRKALSYHNPFPQQLMFLIGGRPYIDVRNSFNSLIPDTLPNSLSEKLVNHYINRLDKKPELHDKVEFEILITCLTFDFEKQASQLLGKEFNEEEISLLKKSLQVLTNKIVVDEKGVISDLEKRVEQLESRRNAILNLRSSKINYPYMIEKVLQDCINYGTIPFSALARCAFIGTSLLRSLVNTGVLTEEQSSAFLQSIDTVATDMLVDLDCFYKGKLSQREFLKKYGHLRPGTYDIISFSYKEKPDLYFSISQNQLSKGTSYYSGTKDFSLNNEQRRMIEELLKINGFAFSVDDLFSFIENSIKKREAIKFEFTKNLSTALEIILEYGEYHGFLREDLAFLEIDTLLQYSSSVFSINSAEHFKQTIERNKKYYQLSSYLHLPDIIRTIADVRMIELQSRQPNFITQKKVTASIVEITNEYSNKPIELDGKIVLIENADPGFDWIFSKSIAGLITKYGGVASHMAIRCSEFGLPAAIGCGDKIYAELAKANCILLNCMEKKIEAF